MSLEAAARLALHLAVPPISSAGADWPDERAAGAADSSRLVSILAANKVHLLSIARRWDEREDPFWREFVTLPEIAAAIREQASRKAALLGAYLDAAAAMRAEGIEPVLFKSPAWFPYLSSNLDVLVPPSRFLDAARILERLGHLRLPHYREDHKLLYRTFAGGRPALSVHLHEAVSWGKVLILPGEAVVARRVGGEDSGVSVASPRDALAATIAHTIFETDQIRLSDLRIARRSLIRGARVEDLIEEAARGRWLAAAASGLLLYDGAAEAGGVTLLAPEERRLAEEALERYPWAARASKRILGSAGPCYPFVLPRWFSKEHLVRLVLADDRRDGQRKVFDLGASAWNLVSARLRIRCRPACLITVSGPDGSGKSSVAEAVAAALALCEVPVRTIWSRGGFSAPAVAGKALARRIAPGRVPSRSDERAKRSFLESGWRRALWTWVVALEQAAAMQRVRLWRLLGRSVVCDRYVYDTLADLLARIPPESRQGAPAAGGFLLGATPTPDLSFIIDVAADVAHARKGDGTTLEARRRLAAAYAFLSEVAPFARLDGEHPLPENLQRAVTESLRRCFARFEEGRL